MASIIHNTALQFYILLQILVSLIAIGILHGFPFLCTTLIAVGCAQIQKLNAALLDTRYEYVKPRRRQKYAEDYKIAKRKMQTKLNACILHHQEIMA